MLSFLKKVDNVSPKCNCIQHCPGWFECMIAQTSYHDNPSEVEVLLS